MKPANINDPLRTTDYVSDSARSEPSESRTPNGHLLPVAETVTHSDPEAAGEHQSTLPGDAMAVSTGCELPIPTIPGYEIEGVLGRGGMGVVYKARHLALKRTVALKMVLAGGHAGPQELARFRIEAEAVARLQHPNIVQIHEVGAAGGHPYCALEFVDGGSLDQKLRGQPLPPREAAKLIETLARAIQLAHSRNVVHRDLKPGNVLLTADGTVKVTDFGLARHLDSDSGETQAGAIMGTPSYMAPEQASGRSHDAGPAADIHALGAMLYECLAGRPPFKGGTLMETLEQVRTQEPVQPSHWQPRVPVDLETVALKCLRKEPENRYASAGELADELGRFLRGEPVQARPIGRVERGWRWCRRYPALASALATVVGVLVLASVVSTQFGIDAHNKEAAVATKNLELEKKNKELELKQYEYEGALAQTVLTPLAEVRSPLNDAEISAFNGPAFGNKRLADRFLTEALSNRQGKRKLRARAAFALQSVVGLDARKRQEVERRLVQALAEPDLADESRTDLALALTELGELSLPAAAVVAQTLLQALTRTNDAKALQSLAQGLSAVAVRLEPREAAATLTQAMTRTNERGALTELVQGLSAVAARLEAKETAAAAAALTQAMASTDEPVALGSLAQGLSAIAARMEAKEAAATIATLTQAMTRTNDHFASSSLAQCLSAVAARLEPREAAAMLTQILIKTINPDAVGPLALGLSAVAARLEPQEAAKVAATLRQPMNKASNRSVLGPLAQSLSAVVVRLEPQEAAKAAVSLGQAMIDTNDPGTLRELARCLMAVAARLEPKEASRVSAQAVAALMAKANDQFALPAVAQCLAVVAAHLEPKEAADAAAALTQAMTPMKGPYVLECLAQGLAPVAARMEPKEAATRLTQTMIRTKNRTALESLVQGLSLVAARLEPKERARLYAEAAATLTQTMTNTKDPYTLAALAQGLSLVAVRMEPKEAAATLTQAMTNTIGPYAPRELAQGLSLAVARLEPKEAVASLTQARARTNDPGALGLLNQGLSAAAARLEPKEPVPASVQAATLMEAMSKTNDWMALRDLAHSLPALAARLEHKEAMEAAVTLMQAMNRTNNPYALWSLARGLSAMAARLETKEAAHVCAQPAAMLIQAMARSNDSNGLQFLAEGLSAILGDDQRRQRAGALAASIVSLHESQGLPGALALLPHATELFPRRLSDQELVELLKRPLCVGSARRTILDHLEYCHQRPFADQWDFVRFAEQQKLDLDFITLPQRPLMSSPESTNVAS